MKTIRGISVLSALICVFGCVRNGSIGTNTGSLGANPKGAAQGALDDFKTGMDDSTARILGFRDAADGKNSRLGQPIRVYDMACSAVMQVADSGERIDPTKMTDREKYYFPLQDAEGNNRSLILVSRLKADDGYGKKDLWSPVQVGAAPLMKQIDAALKTQPKERIPSLFIAQSPGLGAAFLGFESGGEIRLAPAALIGGVDSCMNYPARGKDKSAGWMLAALSRCQDRKSACN